MSSLSQQSIYGAVKPQSASVLPAKKESLVGARALDTSLRSVDTRDQRVRRIGGGALPNLSQESIYGAAKPQSLGTIPPTNSEGRGNLEILDAPQMREGLFGRQIRHFGLSIRERSLPWIELRDPIQKLELNGALVHALGVDCVSETEGIPHPKTSALLRVSRPLVLLPGGNIDVLLKGDYDILAVDRIVEERVASCVPDKNPQTAIKRGFIAMGVRSISEGRTLTIVVGEFLPTRYPRCIDWTGLSPCLAEED